MHSSNQEIADWQNNEHSAGNELAAIVKEHPYYSLAQFRLLASYKKTRNPLFDQQACITALFFNNPKWLNWQLNLYTNDDTGTNASVSKVPAPQMQEAARQSPVSETKKEELHAFEPLHLIDYFASQGIKINEEALTDDKLGTQLKSFTEWLKSMKKIHTDKVQESSEQTDNIIRHIAESSNVSINIATEAMAEVLLKQGKVEQAAEIYRKLSLSNPSESAYFTAKIERLKSV